MPTLESPELEKSNPKGNPEYIHRIDRVIDYLRDNLDRSPSLAELAKVACFSEHHFHRVFSAVTGETVNNFTNRLRLGKACRLLTSSVRSITDIAYDCGFSSPATFSRAFNNFYGLSPSEHRKTGKVKKSKICKDLFPEYEYFLPMSPEEKKAAFPVKIVSLPEREIAYIRVTNSFEGTRVQDTFGVMIAWAKKQGIFDKGTLFGMSQDDPSVTPQHLYRYEVCFATKEPFRCAKGMSRMKMPAMQYAAVRVSGDLKLVATAIDYIFSDWLIHSKYEPEPAPGLEIFLDKEKATDWSNFELDLCVPVKKLEKLEY